MFTLKTYVFFLLVAAIGFTFSITSSFTYSYYVDKKDFLEIIKEPWMAFRLILFGIMLITSSATIYFSDVIFERNV